MARLREHFAAEAQAADLAQAFFSRSAGSGLALFDLLARRYDVVMANPPYMGSKNLGHGHQSATSNGTTAPASVTSTRLSSSATSNWPARAAGSRW